MVLRKNLAFYLDDIETPIGITINLTILGLILISCALFVAETYPLPDTVQVWLNTADVAILIIFTLEYLLRFWCAPSKVKFFLSFASAIDLLSIIPLFFGLIDVRFFRIFRWFRILRLIRFFELKVSIFRIQGEDGLIFARILLTLISIIFVYSGLIYQVEHQANAEAFGNFLDALYFSVVTMTTVGFGDLTPQSESGRLLTLLMIATGVILIPWQLGDLIRQLLKTATKVKVSCSGCGLALHDMDARYCKICGTQLEDASQPFVLKR